MTLIFSFLFLAIFLLGSILNIASILPDSLSRPVTQIYQGTGIDVRLVIVVWLAYGLLLLLMLVLYRWFRRKAPDRAYALERAVGIRRLAWLDRILVVVLLILIVTGVMSKLVNSASLTSGLILWTGLLVNWLRPSLASDLQELWADPQPNQVLLQWEPPREGLDMVIIRRCQDDRFPPTPFTGGWQVYTGSGTSFTDEGLPPCDRYYYWAFVRDQRGRYSRGVQAFASVPNRPPNIQDFSATPEPGQILLRWTLPPSPFIAGVRVIRRADAPPVGPEDGVIVFDDLAEYCVDSSIDERQSECYYAAFSYDDTSYYASGLRLRVRSLGEIIGELDPDAVPDHQIDWEVERVECPLCFQPVYQLDIDRGDAVLCPAHTYVHRDCWDAFGGCPIIGCPHGPS